MALDNLLFHDRSLMDLDKMIDITQEKLEKIKTKITRSDIGFDEFYYYIDVLTILKKLKTRQIPNA